MYPNSVPMVFKGFLGMTKPINSTKILSCRAGFTHQMWLFLCVHWGVYSVFCRLYRFNVMLQMVVPPKMDLQFKERVLMDPKARLELESMLEMKVREDSS